MGVPVRCLFVWRGQAEISNFRDVLKIRERRARIDRAIRMSCPGGLKDCLWTGGHHEIE